MMNRRLLTAGLLLTLLVPLHAFGAKPLYERMKEAVEEQIAREKFDEEIVPYLNAVYKEDWETTEDRIRDFLKGDAGKACNDMEKADDLLSCEDLARRLDQLAEDETRIRTIGRLLQASASSYELPISDLPGRTTKLSADLRAILNIWSAGTGSVKSNINTPIIRSFSADPDIFEPLLTDIGETLETMDDEQMTAAIWRYQYGVRLILNEKSPRFPGPYQDAHSGPGTERQYLFKHWTDLEANLKAVWDTIKDDTFSPPLSANETVYYTFPKSLFESSLPDNVIVWARIDGDSAAGFPFGDVGLQWEVPLEPVLPSLIEEGGSSSSAKAILGGTYPDEPAFEQDEVMEPVDGRGLCTSPVNERGYLCRAFTVISPDERCPVVPGSDPNEVELVYCTNPADGPPQGPWCCNAARNKCSQTATSTQCVTEGGSPSADVQGCAANGCPVPVINPVFCCLKDQGNRCTETINSATCVEQGGSPSETEQGCVANGCSLPAPKQQRFTAAGADVCREIKWKEPAPFDPNTQCKIALRCSNNCVPGVSASAVTGLKQADGTIEICVSEDTEFANTYLIFHELIHANQICSSPPGHNPTAGTLDEKNAICCKREGEGYHAQCAMMERDGVFLNPDGSRITSSDGIPINAETCAEAWTNFACGAQQGYRGCFMSRTYTQPFMQKLIEAGDRNPKGVPALCSEASNTSGMDPRVKQFIELIESRDDVCRPGEVNLYRNRIGNNACYIGQCVEMSIEMHRIAAGQTPGSVGDQMAPWDAPETGTPLGNVLMNPPLTQGRLPSYRPELLMREMEAALCQLQGLPPRTPPILCAVDAQRQLEMTQQIGADTAMGLANQQQEQKASLQDLLDLSQGVGARAGTNMYGQYLRESNRSFAGILTMANELLEELDKIDFPTEMCPAGKDLPPPVTSN